MRIATQVSKMHENRFLEVYCLVSFRLEVKTSLTANSLFS